MPKVTIDELPEGFTTASMDVTECVTKYLGEVFKAGDKAEVNKAEVVSGVMSGVMTALARDFDCARCAGELMQDAGNQLVENSLHADSDVEDTKPAGEPVH